MKNIIEEIVVITYNGLGITSVGINNVAEIKDNSKEWEDHIDFIFDVYNKEGNLLKSIINCPVDIRYKDRIKN